MKGVRGRGSVWLVMVVVFLLVAGAGRLVQQRFASGDVYPPYSSLRSDPLGLKALYDALGELPGRRVERFTSSYLRFPAGPDTVVIFAGVNPMDLWVEGEEFRVLDRFVRGGGRLVLTYGSEEYEQMMAGVKPPARGGPGGRGSMRHLETEWDYSSRVVPLRRVTVKSEVGGVTESRYEPAQVSLAEGLSQSHGLGLQAGMSWHSPGILDLLGAEWRSILVRGTNGVVLAERRVGRGSLVVATDSYWLSNEAMRKAAPLGLVTWALGASTRVVFDETHLGTVESVGVTTMMRGYGLHLFAGVLVVLGGLVVWRMAVSFAPRGEGAFGDGDGEKHVVTAMDAGSGLSNLLRRSVSAEEVLPVCLAEWLKSGKGGRSIPPDKLAAVERLIQSENESIHAGRKTNPVLVYHEITALLRRGSGGTEAKNKRGEG